MHSERCLFTMRATKYIKCLVWANIHRKSCMCVNSTREDMYTLPHFLSLALTNSHTHTHTLTNFTWQTQTETRAQTCSQNQIDLKPSHTYIYTQIQIQMHTLHSMHKWRLWHITVTIGSISKTYTYTHTGDVCLSNDQKSMYLNTPQGWNRQI